MKIYTSIVILLCFSIPSNGQISLNNSSFEDQPADATVPHGWWGCEQFTTPDILPGYWGVYQKPVNGKTYVGLITRENGTWESIGQRLSQPLEKDRCYSMNISLAYSSIYAGYNRPIKLRIYISDDKCEKDQLIFESPLIDHTEWKVYNWEFSAKGKSKYIILEAYSGKNKRRIKGNILLDHLSSLFPCGRA